MCKVVPLYPGLHVTVYGGTAVVTADYRLIWCDTGEHLWWLYNDRKPYDMLTLPREARATRSGAMLGHTQFTNPFYGTQTES